MKKVPEELSIFFVDPTGKELFEMVLVLVLNQLIMAPLEEPYKNLYVVSKHRYEYSSSESNCN